MTKIVSLTDEAYMKLAKLKKEKESFTDVVMRLTEKEKKKSLLEFAGAWKGSKEELDRIEKELKEERENTKFREVDL